MTKKEASGKIYTELPLLRVKVVPVTMILDGISSLSLYVGGRSIPIKLSISKVPTNDIKFDILFLGGDLSGKINVANKQQQFTLNEDKLAFFLQIEAYDTTITPQTLQVTVRPVLKSSNFVDKVITINLIAKPASIPALAVAYTTAPTSANLYDYSFKTNTNQQVFIYYYAQPNYLFTSQTKDTVRAWALNGQTFIPGDIVVGSIGIVTLGVDIESLISGLIADTTYKVVAY